MADQEQIARPFLRRVRIKNFKSIEHCHVELGPLTALVGRNGSGKSNFLDALHFVADALRTSLDHAIKARGGIDEVRRRSTGHPRNFAIELEANLPEWRLATFGFEVAARKNGAWAVKQERLRILDGKGTVVAYYHRAESEVVEASVENAPPVLEDRLYLVNAAGLPAFRPAYDSLLAMGFYSLNPDAIKELQNPDAGEILREDGSNIASVVARLNAQQPETLERVRSYLSTIVQEITKVDRVALGPRETLQFWQRVQGSPHPWRFYAASMSDGTLRALGALVATNQLTNGSQPVRLVGIEEPETALHPAAAGALMDALREAAVHTQIVITSHSPDLVDQLDLEADTLLAVASTEGTTAIGPADQASLEAVRKHLYSAGELLRMDQLQPDLEALARQAQADLFADPAG